MKRQTEPEEKKGTPPLKPLPSYHEMVMATLDTLRLHAPMEFNNPNEDRAYVKCAGEIANPFVIHNITGDSN